MPPKVRVLYVIDSLVAGGVESQMVELIAQLDRERFEPHVLVFYGRPLRPPHFLSRLKEIGAPVTMLNLGLGAIDKARATAGIVSMAWRVRPHIIQAENHHANLLTRAARPMLPPGTRVIGAIRVTYTARQLWYERMNSWLCDAIVASADHLKHQLIKDAGVAPSRLVVIPNSVDIERFSAASKLGAQTRAQLASGKRRLLISMGRVSRQKRMDLLASALGVLKHDDAQRLDCRVAIIGPNEEEEATRLLDEAIDRDELGEIVLRLGSVANPETYFAACDASVLASDFEGLPVVALESLAAGKPVVLSAGANPSGLIEDGETGWVAPSNAPDDLAAALRRMLAASDEELARMGERCRERVQEYAIVTLARRYMALYDALAVLPRSASAKDRWKALAEATR